MIKIMTTTAMINMIKNSIHKLTTKLHRQIHFYVVKFWPCLTGQSHNVQWNCYNTFFKDHIINEKQAKQLKVYSKRITLKGMIDFDRRLITLYFFWWLPNLNQVIVTILLFYCFIVTKSFVPMPCLSKAKI